MIQEYLTWFYSFCRDMIAWLGSALVADGVSLLGFLLAISLLCIVIGGLVFR